MPIPSAVPIHGINGWLCINYWLCLQEAAVEAELRARAAARQAHQHSDDEEDEEEDDHHHHHHLHQHSDVSSMVVELVRGMVSSRGRE